MRFLWCRVREQGVVIIVFASLVVAAAWIVSRDPNLGTEHRLLAFLSSSLCLLAVVALLQKPQASPPRTSVPSRTDATPGSVDGVKGGSTLSDPVTKLPTQHFLYTHVAKELAKARRHTFPVSIVEMEVDNYQQLVRDLGEGRSEAMIRDLAWALKRQLRESDVIARVSESELSVVLSVTAQREAQILIRRLRHVSERFRYRGQNNEVARVKMSFGCASFPDHGRTCESLILRANTNRVKRTPAPAAAATIIPFRK